MADYNFRYRSKQTNLKRHKTVRATSEVEARIKDGKTKRYVCK
jgi:hypothetical protein